MSTRRRVVLHDFSGHPFQLQLAHALAEDPGLEVTHVQCSSYASGKGAVDSVGSGRLRMESISIGATFDRYSFARRTRQESRYGAKFVALCRRIRPDYVISCNDPLIAKAMFGAFARARGIPWMFWLQDFYSLAIDGELRKRRWPAPLAGRAALSIEARLLRSADRVVAITEDFLPTLDAWSVDPKSVSVIPNWAPLEDLPLGERDGSFRRRLNIGDRFMFLYAGTLGLKHNPEMLVRLACEHPDAMVVVASEGLGAEHLGGAKDRLELDNLMLLPYQPWETVPDMLAAADALIVLLESDAGRFSVPSKILTYLCAGRPILAAMPPENLGSRTIVDNGAGLVVSPNDVDGFCRAAQSLRLDESARSDMSAAGRRYAESTFDIDSITDRFRTVIGLD